MMTELQASDFAAFNPEWIGIDPFTDRAMATYFLFHDPVAAVGFVEPADHALGRSRGGLPSKLHLCCDGRGLPLQFHVDRRSGRGQPAAACGAQCDLSAHRAPRTAPESPRAAAGWSPCRTPGSPRPRTTRRRGDRARVAAAGAHRPGLQGLPARQRAILILRDVLAFSAAETAEVLGATMAAVKSGLQRARARLDASGPQPTNLLEPHDQRARALLDGYIAAFERSDARLLEQVLRTDATPFRDWPSGRSACLHVLDAYVLGAPGTGA